MVSHMHAQSIHRLKVGRLRTVAYAGKIFRVGGGGGWGEWTTLFFSFLQFYVCKISRHGVGVFFRIQRECLKPLTPPPPPLPPRTCLSATIYTERHGCLRLREVMQKKKKPQKSQLLSCFASFRIHYIFVQYVHFHFTFPITQSAFSEGIRIKV